jgi:hypothetical protein
LDSNQTADKEEYSDKQKEIEGICSPIIKRLYEQAGGAPQGMPGAPQGAPQGAPGPTVEEVD